MIFKSQVINENIQKHNEYRVITEISSTPLSPPQSSSRVIIFKFYVCPLRIFFSAYKNTYVQYYVILKENLSSIFFSSKDNHCQILMCMLLVYFLYISTHVKMF